VLSFTHVCDPSFVTRVTPLPTRCR
jgi:hypothetical protein